MNHAEGATPIYRMTLYVAGEGPNSRAAQENLAALCARELRDRCELEVVDVLEDVFTAAARSILVTPTLMVEEPEPEVVIVGNLSNRARVRRALRLAGE